MHGERQVWGTFRTLTDCLYKHTLKNWAQDTLHPDPESPSQILGQQVEG